MKTLVLLAMAPLLVSADRLVGGPYVVNTGARSATVMMWIVESAQASLGASPDRLDRKAPALHPEKVSFTGLEAGKVYYYDIGQGEAGKGSSSRRCQNRESRSGFWCMATLARVTTCTGR